MHINRTFVTTIVAAFVVYSIENSRDYSVEQRAPAGVGAPCANLFSDSYALNRVRDIKSALALRQRWLDESLMVSSDFAETKLYWYPSARPLSYFEGIDQESSAVVFALGGAGLKTSSGANWA